MYRMLLLVFIIVFLSGIAFFIVWFPVKDRRNRMVNLGYKQARSLESDVLIRIKRMHHFDLNKKNIYRFSGEGAQFFVIFSKQPSVLNDVQSFIFGVYSEKLNLPGLKLSSKTQSTQRLNSVMNTTLEQLAELEAAEQRLHKITFPHIPGFNERFILLAEDEKTLVQFFVMDRSEKLTQLKEDFELNGEGRLFTLKMNFRRDDLTLEDRIRKTSGLGKKIYRIFKD